MPVLPSASIWRHGCAWWRPLPCVARPVPARAPCTSLEGCALSREGGPNTRGGCSCAEPAGHDVSRAWAGHMQEGPPCCSCWQWCCSEASQPGATSGPAGGRCGSDCKSCCSIQGRCCCGGYWDHGADTGHRPQWSNRCLHLTHFHLHAPVGVPACFQTQIMVRA